MPSGHRRWTLPRRAVAGRLPKPVWQRYCAGAGAKGHRYHDWAWVAIDPGRLGQRWLLVRRNRHTKELAFYRCYCPRHTPLPSMLAARPRPGRSRSPATNRKALQQAGHPVSAQRLAAAAMARLAAAPPILRQDLSSPAASLATMKITTGGRAS